MLSYASRTDASYRNHKKVLSGKFFKVNPPLNFDSNNKQKSLFVVLLNTLIAALQRRFKDPCQILVIKFLVKICLNIFYETLGDSVKQAPAQVFSCEFCDISKNTFSYRTPPVAIAFSRYLFLQKSLS